MADESEDDSSKTEEPSQRKLDDARKKGQMVSSREINHFFMMGALLVFVIALGGPMGRETLALLAPLIIKPETIAFNSGGLQQLLTHLVKGTMLVLLLPALLTILAALAPAILQRKWVFAFSSIAPKLEKISPLAGFKRLFGMKALIEFLKNLLKISAIAVAASLSVWPFRDQVMESLRNSPQGMMEMSQWLAGRMLTSAVIFLFLLSLGDYLYQRFIFMKSMRMTKHEVKEEYKQQEGDPHIKQKVRQIRRDKARKRMMANVPNADVIITNPTHYAVALQYNPATMPAPKLLAKGTDEVALRIRELAEKNKIPIIRNPPLARVLYATTEIDEEIPVDHYQAVAKVIGYVYKLKGKTPPRPPAKAQKKAPPPSLNIKKK